MAVELQFPDRHVVTPFAREMHLGSTTCFAFPCQLTLCVRASNCHCGQSLQTTKPSRAGPEGIELYNSGTVQVAVLAAEIVQSLPKSMWCTYESCVE